MAQDRPPHPPLSLCQVIAVNTFPGYKMRVQSPSLPAPPQINPFLFFLRRSSRGLGAGSDLINGEETAAAASARRSRAAGTMTATMAVTKEEDKQARCQSSEVGREPDQRFFRFVK